MDFKRFALTLASGWTVLLAGVVVLTALAYAAFVLQPRTYEATAQSVLTQQAADGAGETDQSRFATDAVSNYSRIATTPYVLDRVRERLDLDVSRTELQDDVEAIAIPETSVIEVTARSATARGAAALANAVAEQLGEAVTQITPGAVNGTVISVTQLQQAIAPEKPIAPRGPLYLALGLVLGLVLGLAIVVLRDLLTVRVRLSREVEDALDAPVVGFVPGRSHGDRAIIAVERGARRPRAEAFRTLRTNVLRLLSDVGGRSLVVTGMHGASAQDVAANLALATADAGRSVLLIDADLRQGSLARLLGADTGTGLTEVLLGTAELRSAITSVRAGRMSLLTTGTLPEGPSELLQSDRMTQVVAEATADYDVVILSAHALPGMTDATVAAGLAAGALLVVPLGSTRRSEVVEAASALERAGARVLGAVIAPGRRLPGRVRAKAVSARAGAPRPALGR